jgi:hypothetical protein
MAQPDRPQMTLWRMRTKCWIPKAPNANPEHVIRIAFSLQQWLHGRALMLRYTYTVSRHKATMAGLIALQNWSGLY